MIFERGLTMTRKFKNLIRNKINENLKNYDNEAYDVLETVGIRWYSPDYDEALKYANSVINSEEVQNDRRFFAEFKSIFDDVRV